MWRQRGRYGAGPVPAPSPRRPPRVRRHSIVSGDPDPRPTSSEAAPLCGRQKEMGMKPKFSTRKGAALIATAGLSLMLVGAGLSATFSDSGVVSQSVAVGTFKIELSGAGGVVSPDGKSITFTAPTIVSSAPASAPLAFSVKNIGSIPVTLHVEAAMSGGSARFSALGGNPADVVGLVSGATADYAGGLQWSELVNDDLGRAVSITYTISAQG